MAEYDAGNVRATFEVQAKGIAETEEKLRRLTTVLAINEQQQQQASQAYLQAEKNLTATGMSVEELTEMIEEGVEAQQEWATATDETRLALAHQIQQATAAANVLSDVTGSSQDLDTANRKLAGSQRNVTVALAETEIAAGQNAETVSTQGNAYRSSYTDVRAYSEGLYRMFDLMSGGDAIMTTTNALMMSLTRNSVQWMDAWKKAQAAGTGVKGFFANVTQNLKGMIGPLGVAVVGIAAVTIAVQKWQQRKQDLKQLEEDFTRALKEQNSVIAENVALVTMKEMEEDDDLKTLNALGLSASEFNRVVVEGGSALSVMGQRLIELKNSGEITNDEFRDMINKVDEVSSKMGEASETTEEWNEALQRQQDYTRLAFDTSPVQTWAQALGIPLKTLLDIRNEYLGIENQMDSLLAAQFAQYDKTAGFLRLIERENQLRREMRGETDPAKQEEIGRRFAETQAAIAGMIQAADAEGFDLVAAAAEQLGDTIEDIKDEFREGARVPALGGLYQTQRDLEGGTSGQGFLDDMVAGIEATDVMEAAEAWEDTLNAMVLQGMEASHLSTLDDETADMIDQGLVGSIEQLNQQQIYDMYAGGVNEPMVGGILHDLENLGTRLGNIIGPQVTDSAIDIIQGYLRSHSPSQLWADEVGVPIAEGIIEGLASVDLEGRVITEVIDELQGAQNAIQSIIAYRQAQMNLERTEERLEDLRYEIEFLREQAEIYGMDTLTPQSAVAMERAEDRLFSIKRAHAIGLASDAELALAQFEVEQAQRKAETYSEALEEAEREAEILELQVIDAQMQIVTSFATMIEAGLELEDAMIETFQSMAEEAGLSKDAVDEITASLQVMHAWALTSGAVLPSSGGGGGVDTSRPRPHIVGAFGGAYTAATGQPHPGTFGEDRRSAPVNVSVDVRAAWPVDDGEARSIATRVRDEIKAIEDEENF